MSEQTAAEATERNHRKVRRGYVVSDKMDKTVVVLVEERYKHSLYGKVLRRSKKVKVHDEANSAHVGDLVSIMETRPLSATKRWRLVEIVEKAKYGCHGRRVGCGPLAPNLRVRFRFTGAAPFSLSTTTAPVPDSPHARLRCLSVPGCANPARLCAPVLDGSRRAGLCQPAPQRYPLRRRRYWRHLGLYIKEEGHLTQW